MIDVNIIIVGAGKIGGTVASSLAGEGHNVAVIDTDQKVVDTISVSHDVIGICGNGAMYQTQLDAGADKAELLIATTATDELNILCCLVARKIGIKNTIARVRNPEYSEQSSMITDDFGISLTVNPEFDTAREISRILRFPSVNSVDSFFNGRVELAGIRVRAESELIGLSLSDISRKYHSKVLVCAVKRNDEAYIPSGSFVIEADDQLYISGKRNDLSAFMKRLGEYKSRIRTVMLVGGGRIAFYLSRQLADSSMTVKLIEKDEERCNELVNTLDREEVTVVLNDGTVQEVLAEQGLPSQDAFVSLTGIDEENIIMSMYAQNIGVDKVITKINRFPSELLGTFGLDSVISPKMLTTTRIIAFVRALQGSGKGAVRTLYRLVDGKAEALEFEATAEDKCINTTFKELSLRPNLLIAAILRKNKIIHPRGDDRIEVGDRVIVVTSQSNLTHLDGILR